MLIHFSFAFSTWSKSVERQITEVFIHLRAVQTTIFTFDGLHEFILTPSAVVFEAS